MGKYPLEGCVHSQQEAAVRHYLDLASHFLGAFCLIRVFALPRRAIANSLCQFCLVSLGLPELKLLLLL